jgi:outer membrane protein assembly factor BamB
MRAQFVARTFVFSTSVAILLAGISNAAQIGTSPDPAKLAGEILAATGVKGGLVVHVGCADGRLTAALRASDSFQVQGLDRDPVNVDLARQYIKSQGVYGPVAIDRLNGNRLPYIDNLINLVVAEDISGIGIAEVIRVLVPGGVAYIREGSGWQKTVKPRPDNIDEWTHFLYDSSGNAVSHDEIVGPPKHLQWLGSPRWSRHHDRMASMSGMVSAAGRIFYIMDEGSRISIQMPPEWTLIARDAFNGTILWRRPIEKWHSHLWPLKSGPTQLARRLVAIGDRVYVTLGINAPLTALDAATGEVLQTYEDSASTEEVIVRDGMLIALVNKGSADVASFAPKFNTGDQARVAAEYAWNEQPRQVAAFDAQSGKRMWTLETKVAPLTLTADADSVVFHDGEKIVCLDRATGQPRWNSAKAERRQRFTMNFGPRLLLYKEVVLFAGGDRKMHAFAKQDGKELWNAPHAQSGYQSPEDLIVAAGLVWNAPTTRTQDSGAFIGRDPLTGEAKVEFPPDINTYWFHHRCYITKATDNFLMPSRTGIEFVDIEKKQWNINHWVRGGCLYGVMPCNGLVYAPPHNCACYPETKLYGINALGSASRAELVPDPTDQQRLTIGPAFGNITAEAAPSPADWPTYRHDLGRSGYTPAVVPASLRPTWQTKLNGRLTSLVVADGRLYVAQVDEHTLHALDAASGRPLWSFTAGGRIDSPPTIDRGRVVFGSADGSVYCLRAADGVLAWQFRAAPYDLRMGAFEQIESVWPVHGSVLIQDNIVTFAAGRSNFLDGGLRFLRLDADSGETISENIIDDKDPETGENLQNKLQVLNMPSGLPDILSSDGESVYMRSQQFDNQGNRVAIGPHSGQAAVQGAVQKGKTAHVFAPMGFLDETWFHRSYWTYGRSSAGGHSGYYQAAKYAPSGRILVTDSSNVYCFGRKPEYLRWTTTMEHQLFATGKEGPEQALEQTEADQRAVRRGEASANLVRFERTASINPTNTPLAVMAWVNTEQPTGVIAARGGPRVGYALLVRQGKPQWVVRTEGDKVASVTGPQSIVGGWVHLAGVLTSGKQLQLYVNGRLAASAEATGLIPSDPAQSLELGGDNGGAVGDYPSPSLFLGTIDEVRLYHGNVTAEEIAALAKLDQPGQKFQPKGAELRLFCSFDNGDAKDDSGNKNDGTPDGNRVTDGKLGRALRFQGRSAAGGPNTFVQRQWAQDVPLLVRAMIKAADVLFVAGPADLIDEEATFQALVAGNPQVEALLSQQNEALEGKLGAKLLAVSAADGRTLAEYQLDSLPVWDGMAAANGRLYLSTLDGSVLCFGDSR